MRSDFRGWVFYVDADSIFSDPSWDVPSLLRKLREEGKFLLGHDVLDVTDSRYQWYEINDGTFAIDLASPYSREIIRAWRSLYDALSDEDYRRASSWDSIINDQDSLQAILRSMGMYHPSAR